MNRRWLCGATVVLAACGGSDEAVRDVAEPVDVAEPADGADGMVSRPIALVPREGRLVLEREGAGLVALVLDSIKVARFEGDLDAWNWDPWWLDSDSEVVSLIELPEVMWGAAGEGVSQTSTVVRDDAVTLVFAAESVPYLRFALEVGPGELLYGGGNLHDGPTLNGRRLAMQLEAEPGLEVFYNERHVAVPLVVSSAGWGMWVESPQAQSWDVGRRVDGRLEVTVGGPVSEVKVHLFAAAHPLDVYRAYYASSGVPRVPPPWAFGPWIWRDETPGQGAAVVDTTFNPGVLHDLAAIRAHDLPTSAYWIDRPYATALNTFDFAADDYEDPAAMLRFAQANGFRMALWHTPYVVPAAEDVFADISEIEGFPEPSGISLNTFSATPIDLTRAAVRAYWVNALRRYIDLGIEGFKLDFAEDVVHGLPGARTNRWGFGDGSDERTMAHDYARLYHETYREALSGAPEPEVAGGGFILARAGRAGGHAAVDVLWPGDLDADFAVHGQDGRVGGLPAALSYALSTSASGYPFFAADTGGYRNGPPSAEAYRRWFELTSVMPVMQVGGSDNQVPWEQERFGWDDGLLDDYREHARLHIRLYPYVRSLAARLGEDVDGGGRPLVRPLGLAHPECGVEPGDQYLLGEALLVAPVVAEGVVERTVVFPAGRWVDWWSGEVLDLEACGPRVVAAPLGRVPLWLRSGGVVPMLRAGVDTLAPSSVDVDGIDSAADDWGALFVEVVPGPATFFVWDGTRLEVSAEGGDTLVEATAGSEHRGVVWSMWASRPSAVASGGMPLTEVADEARLLATPGTWRHVAGRLQVNASAAAVRF